MEALIPAGLLLVIAVIAVSIARGSVRRPKPPVDDRPWTAPLPRRSNQSDSGSSMPTTHTPSASSQPGSNGPIHGVQVSSSVGNSQSPPATYRPGANPTGGSTVQPPARPQSSPAATASKSSQTYRPKSGSQPSSSNLQFGFQVPAVTAPDTAGLVDALTGVPLQPQLGLFQCERCKVFYHTQSYAVIRSVNGGQCVACRHTTITRVIDSHNRGGTNADASIVTLSNYQSHVGRVITFEGIVFKVLESSRGCDYAVMFEDKSWTRGFKMVAFGGNLDKIGGTAFILGLAGHRIRVRGLLACDPTFGYEIIISDRAMILRVQ